MTRALSCLHLVVAAFLVMAGQTAVATEPHATTRPQVEFRAGNTLVVEGSLAAMAGELQVFSGRLSSRAVRPVVLQRRSGTRWVNVTRSRTTRTGTYRIARPAPALVGKVTYRIWAPAVRTSKLRLRAVGTPARSASTVTQSIEVAPPVAPASPGSGVRLHAAFSPARPGRRAVITDTTSGVTQVTAQDAHGHVEVLLPVPADSADVSIRFEASAAGGAAAIATTVVIDVAGWTETDALTATDSNVLWTAIDCATPSMCVGSGEDAEHAGRVAHFDGAAWSAPRQLNPFGPLSVSCGAPTMCLALGRADRTTDSTSVYRFDGVSWTGPTTISATGIIALDCLAADFCMAVFRDETRTFDGDSWSEPQPLGVTLSNPTSDVSCSSRTFCAAVSTSTRAVLSWDGSGWATTPAPHANYGLFHIECAEASACLVSRDGSIYRFAGGTLDTTRIVGSAGVQYESMSCPSDTFCGFGGQAEDRHSMLATLGASGPGQALTPGTLLRTDRANLDCPQIGRCVGLTWFGRTYVYR